MRLVCWFDKRRHPSPFTFSVIQRGWGFLEKEEEKEEKSEAVVVAVVSLSPPLEII